MFLCSPAHIQQTVWTNDKTQKVFVFYLGSMKGQTGHKVYMTQTRHAYKILSGSIKVRSNGIPLHIWEDNITMQFR